MFSVSGRWWKSTLGRYWCLFLFFSLTTENFVKLLLLSLVESFQSRISPRFVRFCSGFWFDDLFGAPIKTKRKEKTASETVSSSLACHFYGLCQKIVFALTKIMMRPCHKMCDSQLFNDENVLLIAKTADCWLHNNTDFAIFRIETMVTPFFTLISHIKLSVASPNETHTVHFGWFNAKTEIQRTLNCAYIL